MQALDDGVSDGTVREGEENYAGVGERGAEFFVVCVFGEFVVDSLLFCGCDELVYCFGGGILESDGNAVFAEEQRHSAAHGAGAYHRYLVCVRKYFSWILVTGCYCTHLLDLHLRCYWAVNCLPSREGPVSTNIES